MKTIYKSLMAVAAVLVLIPAAHAQNPNHYIFDGEKGIGINKYLLNTTPDANGEYMLHIENFITGSVKATTTPTDFVLVLDTSGSMMYDYLTREQASDNKVPKYITKAENDALSDDNLWKLKKDDGLERNMVHYSYSYFGSSGAVGGSLGGSTSFNWAVASATPTESEAVVNRWYYFEEDQIFYRLYRNSEKVGSNTYYYIYFDRTNGERRYLVQGSDNSITTQTTIPGNTTSTRVIIIDHADGEYHLYRYAARKDALKKGVNAFLETILEENNKTEQWKEGVTKHQVSVVAFSGNNAAPLTEPTTTGWNTSTKVAKIFREISDSNVDSYKNWDANEQWYGGGTNIYRGVHAARQLFEQLQLQPNMNPINQAGGTNRKKVLIVFTDGEPSTTSIIIDGTTYSGTRGACYSTVNEGFVIKKTGRTEINGLVYTINLSDDTTYVPAFLEHLSSNYPEAKATGATTGNAAASMFTGDKTGDGFYMDASAMENLEEAFRGIAADNTGALNTTLVAVDIVSDSFMIPFVTEDLDRVTMYTAECIGLTGETFLDLQGHPHSELAFAQPIKVDERRGLQHLWVIRDNGAGESEWRDLGDGGRIDIDDDVTFRVSNDQKSIIVSGFNYADLWCGEDLYHENTRQMASDDPNAAYALPGYRGFKIIFEFPIKLDPDALGGVSVPTNDPSSGLYKVDDNGDPSSLEVQYPEPDLPVPIKLIIQKSGLQMGESANFTVQRKRIGDDSDTYKDFMTFVLTGGVSIPEIRIPNLDPGYYYKVKEGNWSWAYQNVSPEYNTEPEEGKVIKNPIVFENTPIPNTPKHAEAKATNKMSETNSSAEFVN